MATMEITPQELRDIEIREAWRGYHRDDVDELLERAAATIEHLEGENAQLRARGGQGGAPAPQRQPAMAAPTPAPAPAPAAPTPPVRTPETDVIQRTLLLAQKAADEAVAEAKAKAQEIVSESESRAQQLVADAEANARRIADAEKARLEEDIAKLTNARETLTADVDALEQFEREYRERLKGAIQAELDLLEATTGAPPRPALSDVDVPGGGPSWSASQEGVMEPGPAPASTSTTSSPPTVHIEAVPAYAASEGEADWDVAPAGGWSDTPSGEGGDATELGLAREVGDEELTGTGESLDDDAFFASLREAVRDDAPLGSGPDDDAQFFDEDDTEEHRRLFKRRR